jgi:RNA polymerase sigma factor (sigma-70 family)
MSAADPDLDIADGLQDAARDLRRALKRQLGNTDDADDLAQEACLRALQSRERGEIRDPRGFLFRIARNLVVDRARRRQRWLFVDLSDELPAATSNSPERIVAGREELRLVHAAIADLEPPLRRRAYQLHLEGEDFTAIAQTLGLTSRAVKYHVACALAQVAAARGMAKPVRRRT